MSWDQWQLWMRQLAIDDMEVRSADGAGFDANEDFSRRWRWVGQFCLFQRTSCFDENHRAHD
jgi:hypothetical protein